MTHFLYSNSMECKNVQNSLEEEELMVKELKKHLALYSRALGGESVPAATLVKNADLEPADLFATTSSLMSLAHKEALTREETSTVLKSLLNAQQELARLEQRRESGTKRWMALNSELESRRQEEVRQRSR